jgi:hypothetical protein
VIGERTTAQWRFFVDNCPGTERRAIFRSYEMGLYCRDGEFKGLLGAGRHWLFDPLIKVRVDIVSQRVEKIASAGNLNVVLGEKGLAERVVNLL